MSGANVLKKDDVILSIDGHNIDDRGLYDSGIYGRLNYFGIICLNHFVGDTLQLHIVRKRKKMHISFPLIKRTPECYLIPVLDYDAPPNYLIVGGLVFQELTEGYMRIWGADWRKKADKRLLFLHDTRKLLPTPERRRIVILNRTLPAAVNVGYHDKKNLVLLKVNDSPVRDVAHVKELVESTPDEFVRFDFQGGDRIVLAKDALQRSMATIRKIYNIAAPQYIETPPPAEAPPKTGGEQPTQ